ncbi:methyltransferase [Brevibacillus sp. SYP-B805]|nr:methyltransferase [Brevibacillus sp. SYP-B805]
MVLDSPYTLGWTEPYIDVLVTENGYDYREIEERPVVAYLFEPLTETPPVHEARLRSFLAGWGEGVRLIAAETVAEENESWKEAYTPIQVGGWTIAPSWTPSEQLADKQHVLWIDPGAAFGTGYHGTTQDILLLLQEMDVTGKRVLDIGAGSGILSIFCALQGAATPVHAIDINPQSRSEIGQNLAHNRLPDTAVAVIIGDPLVDGDLLPGQADLILINIGGGEAIAMLPLVERTLAPGGCVILSGIVEWIRPKVEKAYGRAGFTVAAEKQSGEWVTLQMRQK